MRQLVLEYGRGVGRQFSADRRSRAAAADRARRFLRRLRGQKIHARHYQGASGAFGNAATRLASFVVKGGAYAYGNYPDIDELYPQQAGEADHEKRAAILDKMQQLIHEKAIYAPIWQLGFLNGVGPRVGESAFGLIAGFAYTAPFEDITIASA